MNTRTATPEEMERHEKAVENLKRHERIWQIFELAQDLVKEGYEPAEIMRFALQGIGPGSMQQGVPMILGKAIAAGLAACADFEFRSEEEIEQEKEWAEEEEELRLERERRRTTEH